MSSKAYWTLSGIEFLYWFAIAAGSFLTVYLQKRGFTAGEVGVINAVNSLVAILATPFWGMISDRLKTQRGVFILCILAGAGLWALIPASAAVLPLMFVLIPVSCFFRNPSGSLLDAYAVQRASQERVVFANARLWGSVSYAVMSIALSLVLPRAGVEASFYLFVLLCFPLVVIMARARDADEGAPRRPRVAFNQMRFGRLFKNYYYITYLVFIVLLQAPLNVVNSFTPYLIADVGSDSTLNGLLFGYRAFLEVPMLIFMKQFRDRRLPLPAALILSGLLNTVDAFCFTRAGSLLQILLIGTFEGLASGLLIGSSVNYIYSLAPEGLNATAHTVAAAVTGFAAFLGNLGGGFIAARFGIRAAYLVSGCVFAVAIAYFFVSLLIGVRRGVAPHAARRLPRRVPPRRA